MHDIHHNSGAMVPAVIDHLRGRGYTLVTPAELAPLEQLTWGRTMCRSLAPGSAPGGLRAGI